MTKPSEGVETMDDATPEESKPKGIKPAKLTAVIVAAVVGAGGHRRRLRLLDAPRIDRIPRGGRTGREGRQGAHEGRGRGHRHHIQGGSAQGAEAAGQARRRHREGEGAQGRPRGPAGRVAGVAARFREGCQFQTTNNMPMTLR